jgi:uncharacterized repeat protein (TIGR02543 family)
VTLTPNPAAGYAFSGWSGDASGTANPLAVTMNSNETIVANFAPAYTLNVSGTNGTVTVNPAQATYAAGTQVTLTPNPASGYYFSGWSGDATGTANPLAVTMNSNKTIVANFLLVTYTLHVSATNGTVTVSPTQASYAPGAQVTLTANPSTGYSFTGWSGSASGTTNPLTVTMNSNKTIAANFAVKYTISVTASPSTAGVASGGGTFAAGSSCTVTGTPKRNHRFLNWTENSIVVSSVARYTFTVSKSRNLVAHFR